MCVSCVCVEVLVCVCVGVFCVFAEGVFSECVEGVCEFCVSVEVVFCVCVEVKYCESEEVVLWVSFDSLEATRISLSKILWMKLCGESISSSSSVVSNI